ncbi:unnamed protein product, partial [Prorocentrum cordatum]
DLERWYASGARRRLLWRSCKIARCALHLDGRLPDARLVQLVLHQVFERRVAPHLRAPRLDKGEMAVVERFVAGLPDKWPGAAARVLIRLGSGDEAQALMNQL